jgi:hypothetical protein
VERAFQLISSKGIAWHSDILQCISSDRADAVRIFQVESRRAVAAGQSRRHRCMFCIGAKSAVMEES